MTKSCVIIGLGQIGVGYDFDLSPALAVYTHARAISLHSAFSLIGAVDPSSQYRSRFEQRYGAPTFITVESAMKQLSPDVVVIATPTKSHVSVLDQVLSSCRPKLILCEKPLAYSVDEGRAMVEMCKKEDVELFVNYTRRSDHGVLEIKRRLDTGEIRTPVNVNAWYSKGILNNGSHILNLLELWIGDILSVNVIHLGGLWDDHDPEPDASIIFERGNAIVRATKEEYFSHFSVELLSPSGRLRYDKGGELIEWQGVYEDPNFSGYRILAEQKETLQNGMKMYQLHVFDQINQHFHGVETTLCTGRQALNTLEAINSIIIKRKL